MNSPPIPHDIFLAFYPPALYLGECINCNWKVSGGYQNVIDHADTHKESNK